MAEEYRQLVRAWYEGYQGDRDNSAQVEMDLLAGYPGLDAAVLFRSLNETQREIVFAAIGNAAQLCHQHQDPLAAIGRAFRAGLVAGFFPLAPVTDAEFHALMNNNNNNENFNGFFDGFDEFLINQDPTLPEQLQDQYNIVNLDFPGLLNDANDWAIQHHETYLRWLQHLGPGLPNMAQIALTLNKSPAEVVAHHRITGTRIFNALIDLVPRIPLHNTISPSLGMQLNIILPNLRDIYGDIIDFNTVISPPSNGGNLSAVQHAQYLRMLQFHGRDLVLISQNLGLNMDVIEDRHSRNGIRVFDRMVEGIQRLPHP